MADKKPQNNMVQYGNTCMDIYVYYMMHINITYIHKLKNNKIIKNNFKIEEHNYYIYLFCRGR